jgi:hypothetical protein
LAPRAVAFLLPLALVACTPDDETAAIQPPVPTPSACEIGQIAQDDACSSPGVPICAEGFSGDEVGGCVAVLPAAICPAGSLAVPGDADCREVAPCEDGSWGGITTDGTTQYVDASFTGTSDGSSSSPWVTIQRAVDAAAAGATVAIAAGSYSEDVEVAGKSVVLWGRCPAMVELRGTPTGTAAIYVRPGADGTQIRGLAITGGGYGIANAGSVDVSAEQLWIHDTGSRGIDIEGFLGPTELSVRDALIENAREIGVFAMQSELLIERSAIRGTVAGSGFGRGVTARTGSTLVIDGSLVEQNSDHGVVVSGSAATITRTVVRDTSAFLGIYGGGMLIKSDDNTMLPAAVYLADSLVERNHTYGVFIDGSEATVERSVVRDTLPQPTVDPTGMVAFGHGIHAQGDQLTGAAANVLIHESVLERNHYAGVSATSTNLTVSATIVRDHIPDETAQAYGRGLLLFHDSVTGIVGSANVHDCIIERNVEVGIFAQALQLTLNNVAIRDTQPAAMPFTGRGLNLQAEPDGLGSVVGATRLLLDGNHFLGLYAEGSDVRLERSVISNTVAEASDGSYGDAIALITIPDQLPGSVELVDCTLQDNERAGIVNFGANIGLTGNNFDCNPIDMNGQLLGDSEFIFEDRGGNSCGCGAQLHNCLVLSHELISPAPLAQ